MILQGEVEQIALMKPKAETEHESGMLEFLEDIIGTSRLKTPLNALSEKVEAANELRAEKMNRVKVVGKELKTLEVAKNEAIKFLETENEITLNKSKYYQFHTNRANEDKEEVQAEFDRANAIYQEAMNEIKKIADEKEKGEKELDEKRKECDEIDKECQKLHKEFEDFEKKDLQLKNTIKTTKEKGKKTDVDLEKEKTKLENLQKQPEETEKKIGEKRTRKDQLENELAIAQKNLDKAMTEIKADTEPLQKKKDELEAKKIELQEGLNRARTNMDLKEKELHLYQNSEKNAKAKLQDARARLDRTIATETSVKSKLEKLNTEIPKIEQELQNSQTELTHLENEKVKVNQEYQITNAKYEELRQSEAHFRSNNKVLNAIMKARKTDTNLNGLTGILGRLGDLAGIDKKYDIAISNACGCLNHIITETADEAHEAIKFLKANSIGQTTFIGIDKFTRGTRIREQTQYPEDVPRLFDLIKFIDNDQKEKIRSVFYRALGETLVAKDWDQAKRVAWGYDARYRVVTLNGEIFDAHGAITAGGRPRSGLMGASATVFEVDQQEIRRQGEHVQQLKRRLDEIRNKQEIIRKNIDLFNADLKQMKEQVPICQVELQEHQKMQDKLKETIKDREQEAKKSVVDSNRLKQYEDDFERAKQEFEEEDERFSSVNNEVTELSDKIDDILSKKIGTGKKQVRELKDQLEFLKTDISKAEVSLKTVARNIEKSKDKIKNMEEERETLIKTLEEAKKNFKENENLAKECAVKYEEVSKQKDEKAIEVKKLQSEINKIKTKEAEARSQNLDAKLELEQQQTRVKEKESQVEKWTKKMQELKLNEIDNKPAEIPILDKEEIEKLNPNSIQKEIDRLEGELKKMKPNMAAIEEYKKKETVFYERSIELEQVTQQRDKFKDCYEEVRMMRLNEFKEGFLSITRKLKEMYRMITMGGDAELEYIDSLDPFSEGITFAVRPNKKTWKKISNLSGGEKTLSSLALIFALHYYKPSPLYFMDEIDAALDFKNVSIVAHYIKDRTKNTQFIIISLRNNMYELANRLVGIYKVSNCTKTVTFNPDAAERQVNVHVKKTVTISSQTEKSSIKTDENPPSVPPVITDEVFTE